MEPADAPQTTHLERPPLAPELSDEAAYMMQFFLEDFYLWFSRAYATQIRRYCQPWYDRPTQAPHHRIDEPF